jgi:hypothetical protein
MRAEGDMHMEVVKVVYPANITTQHSLPGMRATRKEDFLIVSGSVGHLLYHEVLMCGNSRSIVLHENNASKLLEFSGALQGHKICEKCAEAYKSNPKFKWMKWVSASRDEENGA